MEKIPVINRIIKDKRKQLKINQVAFSKLINKSTGTIKRYDTGDLIPQNTLILICDVLNLDYKDLILQQYEENKRDDVDYYQFLTNQLNLDRNFIIFDEKKSEIELLKKRLTFLYNFSSCSLDELIFYCEYKENRFYIKKISDNSVIQVLNIAECKELIDKMADFLEYRKYKLNKLSK